MSDEGRIVNLQGELSLAQGEIRSLRYRLRGARRREGALKQREADQHRTHAEIEALLVACGAEPGTARCGADVLTARHYVRACGCIRVTDQQLFTEECLIHGPSIPRSV